MNRYSLALKKKTIPRKKKLAKAPVTLDPFRELRKDIEDIVNDHSGGLKLTELIPALLTKRKNLKISIETLMGVINSSPKLNVLEYTWKNNNRTKYFIYTP